MHASVRLRTSRGRVACPRRPGWTDVERCYDCPLFRRLGSERGRSAVVCGAPAGSPFGPFPDTVHFAWYE